MSAGKTPETDELFRKLNEADFDSLVRMLYHARNLEQQRDMLAVALKAILSNEGDPMFTAPTPQQYANAREALKSIGRENV